MRVDYSCNNTFNSQIHIRTDFNILMRLWSYNGGPSFSSSQSQRPKDSGYSDTDALGTILESNTHSCAKLQAHNTFKNVILSSQ